MNNYVICDICYESIKDQKYEAHTKICHENQLKLLKQYEKNNNQHINNTVNNIIDEIKNTKTILDILPDNPSKLNILSDNPSKLNILPDNLSNLTQTQKKAIEYCNKKAAIYSKNTLHNVKNRLIELNFKMEYLDLIIDYIRNVDLIIHFNSKILIPFILKEDHYKNIFEIHEIDYPSRISWEDNLFNKIYDKNTPPRERVKYGCLNLYGSSKGCASAIGYGRSFMILKDHMKSRISFVNGDSCLKQIHICTLNNFTHLLLYIPDRMIIELIKLAEENIKRTGYLDHMNIAYNYPYIEMQIHGDIIFREDVEKFCFFKNEFNNKYISIFNHFGVPFDIFE